MSFPVVIKSSLSLSVLPLLSTVQCLRSMSLSSHFLFPSPWELSNIPSTASDDRGKHQFSFFLGGLRVEGDYCALLNYTCLNGNGPDLLLRQETGERGMPKIFVDSGYA